MTVCESMGYLDKASAPRSFMGWLETLSARRAIKMALESGTISPEWLREMKKFYNYG